MKKLLTLIIAVMCSLLLSYGAVATPTDVLAISNVTDTVFTNNELILSIKDCTAKVETCVDGTNFTITDLSGKVYYNSPLQKGFTFKIDNRGKYYIKSTQKDLIITNKL